MGRPNIQIDKKRLLQIQDIIKRVRWETGAKAEDVNMYYENIFDLLVLGRCPTEVADCIKAKLIKSINC